MDFIKSIEERANEFRPQTHDQILTAARDLAGRGFSDHTISSILKLSVDQVRRMLGEGRP